MSPQNIIDLIIRTRKDLDDATRQDNLKNSPPWVQRNVKELQVLFLRSDLVIDVCYLMFCNKESLVKNYGSLVYSFHKTYDTSVETAEKIVNYLITKDRIALNPLVQNDGIQVFSNFKKKARPSSNPEKMYEHIMAEFNNERKGTVYLKIGSSSTKDDVIYFVAKSWEKYIKSFREVETHKNQQVKMTRHTLRDTAAYWLMTHNVKRAEVKAIISANFGDQLSDTQLSHILIREAPKTELFALVAETAMQIEGINEKAVAGKIYLQGVDDKSPSFKVLSL